MATRVSSLRIARAERTTNSGVIYRELHRQIVTGALAPGTALSEKTLGESYGVSRTPVREALIRLSEERLVDVLPQQGTFVSRLDIGLIPEAVVIRQALEGATVTTAARIASSEDVARLDDILAQQKFFMEREQVDNFMGADEAFHETIASIALLPGIWSYLRPAKVHIDRARWLTLPFLGRTKPVLAEHRTIRDAIAAHDEDAAGAAMREHLRAVIPDIAQLRTRFPEHFL